MPDLYLITSRNEFQLQKNALESLVQDALNSEFFGYNFENITGLWKFDPSSSKFQKQDKLKPHNFDDIVEFYKHFEENSYIVKISIVERKLDEFEKVGFDEDEIVEELLDPEEEKKVRERRERREEREDESAHLNTEKSNDGGRASNNNDGDDEFDQDENNSDEKDDDGGADGGVNNSFKDIIDIDNLPDDFTIIDIIRYHISSRQFHSKERILPVFRQKATSQHLNPMAVFPRSKALKEKTCSAEASIFL